MINKFILFLFCCTMVHAQNNSIMPNYSVSVCDNTEKLYYFFSPIKLNYSGKHSLPINMIIDEQGEIIYYKKFSKGPFAGSFRCQKKGVLSYYFDNKFYITNSDFQIVDSVYCKNKIILDPHDFIILPNKHFLLLGYETVTMDLSSYNYFNKNGSPGSSIAKVKCDVIQELDINKNVVFEWHGKDYYDFSDVDSSFLFNPSDVDWMHFNAVEYDADGNLLVSVKNFNEITKINRTTGKIIWRLGGKRNQFQFLNDLTLFRGQHDIRRIKNGNITLFDNGAAGFPLHPEGAKEYELDEKKLIAKLVWSFTNNPKAYSSGYGSVQRLENGKTLINYGRSDDANTVFNLVSSSGKKSFEIMSKDSIRNYRCYAYPASQFSIKRPFIKSFIKDNKLYLDAGNGFKSYLWSNGSTQQIIQVKKPDVFFVSVSMGSGGFISSKKYLVKNLKHTDK
jgi:hypothetical protein